jgi:ribonuclease HII
MVLVAGVDEAGRGCAIGPLVVAGVLFEERAIDTLQAMDVRDSKQLSRRKRESLAFEIRELSLRHKYFDLQPRTIDIVVDRDVKLRKLNYLETMVMAKIIRDLRPDIAYVDPADVVVDRFVEQILSVLSWELEVFSEVKADSKYPIVSAASILAKVRRDRIVAELRDEYGDLGSGYPSDKRTVRFLESWFEKHDTCPSFIRGSWSTVKRIRGI